MFGVESISIKLKIFVTKLLFIAVNSMNYASLLEYIGLLEGRIF
jgi:hypothetical protein